MLLHLLMVSQIQWLTLQREKKIVVTMVIENGIKDICIILNQEDFNIAGRVIITSSKSNPNIIYSVFVSGYINNYGNVPFCAYSSYKKLNITFVNNKLKKKLTMEQIPKKYFWYRDLPRLGNNKIDRQKIIKNCYEKSK